MRDGRDGLDGEDGDSAYQIAVRAGFRGTEDAWLKSLHGGVPGSPGQRGRRGKTGEQGLVGKSGLNGSDGSDGFDGWSPILAVVEDGERRVHQVVGWTGGEGQQPDVGWYIGSSGPVERASDATDLRGAKGTSGAAGLIAGGVGISEAQVIALINQYGGGGSGTPELYDSNTPLVAPPYPAIRFARDVDGDVQAIYLSTAT